MSEASHAGSKLADQILCILLRVAVLTRLVAQTLSLRSLSRYSCVTGTHLRELHLMSGASLVNVLCLFQVELILMHLHAKTR